jgi:hypothetical protein
MVANKPKLALFDSLLEISLQQKKGHKDPFSISYTSFNCILSFASIPPGCDQSDFAELGNTHPGLP